MHRELGVLSRDILLRVSVGVLDLRPCVCLCVCAGIDRHFGRAGGIEIVEGELITSLVPSVFVRVTEVGRGKLAALGATEDSLH